MKHNNVLRAEIFLTLIMIVLFLSGCHFTNNVMPKADKGKIDLSQWDFKKDGLANLDGQWELYWGKLLEPSDFQKNNKETKDFINIPNSLTTTLNNVKLPKFGYGTMRLKMQLKQDKDKLYGIETQYILSASKIWINGQLSTSTGTVSSNPKDAVGSFEHDISYFKNESNEVEVVVQMSNFNTTTGKIQSIYFGSKDQLKRDYIKKAAVDIAIFGSLFIMGIYHFILYYKRRKDKSPLYFGIFCLIISLRDILISRRIIFEFIPNIPFELFNKLAYLTFYLALPFFIMFFKENFEKEISNMVVNLIKILVILASLITIFTTIEFYNAFLLGYEIFTVIIVLYILFIIIIASINKTEGAVVVLLGFCFLIIGIIHDILIQSGIVHANSIFPVVFFIFILSQAYMLAAKFSNAFAAVEKLLEENKAVYIDEMTGILNRRGFYDQGENLYNQVTTTGNNFIIFFTDLNKLKTINDSFGHKAGDNAICTSAQILKKSFGKDDIVARISGDEFVIIAVNKSTEIEAKEMIDMINSNFDKYNLYSNNPYKLSIGIGYSIYLPTRKVSFEELLHEADNMLYCEKKAYKLKS